MGHFVFSLTGPSGISPAPTKNPVPEDWNLMWIVVEVLFVLAKLSTPRLPRPLRPKIIISSIDYLRSR